VYPHRSTIRISDDADGSRAPMTLEVMLHACCTAADLAIFGDLASATSNVRRRGITGFPALPLDHDRPGAQHFERSMLTDGTE
jgi:hypothetical protein